MPGITAAGGPTDASTKPDKPVVTSDSNLAQFAKVCSATVVSSDEFAVEINKSCDKFDEESIIKSINNVDEFKKLFGVD